MTKHHSDVVTGVAIAGLIAMAGCSTSQTEAKKSISAASPQMSESKPQSDALKSPGITADSTRPEQEKSSLEALRRGDAPPAARDGALKEVYFDFDRYDLDTEDRAILRANADWLKKNPVARIEVEGHADERGTNEYNLALGAKRAQAAKDYLITLGIAAERIATISYGEEIPVCRSQTEECWEKNRRDHFVTTASGPAKSAASASSGK